VKKDCEEMMDGFVHVQTAPYGGAVPQFPSWGAPANPTTTPSLCAASPSATLFVPRHLTQAAFQKSLKSSRTQHHKLITFRLPRPTEISPSFGRYAHTTRPFGLRAIRVFEFMSRATFKCRKAQPWAATHTKVLLWRVKNSVQGGGPWEKVMQDRQGGRRPTGGTRPEAERPSLRDEAPNRDGGGADCLPMREIEYDPSKQPPSSTDGVKSEDLDKLRKAYEAGGNAKRKGIAEFVGQYGLTRPQVHWLAFKNGFTKLGAESSRLELPLEIQEILQQAAGLGRQATHKAISRALRALLQYPRGAFPHVTRALLWRLVRKYNGPAMHRRYQRARWSADDIEILMKGYSQGRFGAEQAVRELMRRHPDWSRDQIHWKAHSLGLAHRESSPNVRNARKPWSEAEQMGIINEASRIPASSIGKKFERTAWAIQCRLSGLEASSRVVEKDYGLRRLKDLLHVRTNRLQRFIGQGKLRARRLLISGSSLVEWLRKQESARNAAGCTEQTVTRRSASRRWYTLQKAAERLRVTRQDVEELLAKGILKPYRPRIPEKNLWAFLDEHGWELQRDSLEFESPDEEAQRWVKPPRSLTPEKAAALAKMQAQRQHTETITTCRYCGRQLQGNVRGFHESRCPQRPKA